MNAADIARLAFDAMPAGFKGPITFRTAAGATTTARMAVGAPVAVNAREKARSLSVYPDGLTFAPVIGMLATWEGTEWNVIAAHPVIPAGGTAPSMYRVTIHPEALHLIEGYRAANAAGF